MRRKRCCGFMGVSSDGKKAMIRLLMEADRAKATVLLNKDPYHNLYLLGNLEKLGFSHELSQFWGDFSDDGAGVLRGVINRYMNGWAVYGLPDADWPALGNVVDTHPVKAARLQDNPGGVSSLLRFLKTYDCANLAIEELMALPPADFRPLPAPKGVCVRRGVIADLPVLVEFYGNAGDMARTGQAVIRPLQETRLWLAEENSRILSSALTNAETGQLAMIGGVFTQPGARNRGLSQAVCSSLCRELLSMGLAPVLYWQRREAGAVYRKLGFRPIGEWRSVWLQAR
jgi:predicted GNAT family acetyltransferase